MKPSELDENSDFSETGMALAGRCLMHRAAGLSKNELSELVYLAPAMRMMHRAVWLRSAEGIHTVWTEAVQSYRRRPDHPFIPVSA